MFVIRVLTPAEAVVFAAAELKKYLKMMMPEEGDVRIEYLTKGEGFLLGTFDAFGYAVSEGAVPELDDEIRMDCGTSGGILAGSNPRSVLLAVYEYLRQNGCRWLFPGVDGEYIPLAHIMPVQLAKKASFRFRGQCNEGAEAQQNMLETIDFLPKIGMNTYMLEFNIPTYYYDLWYSHAHNPYLLPEQVNNDTVLQWKRMCEAEIAKRGLLFHDMGHGWTAEPFGVDSSDGWQGIHKAEKPIPESAAPYLALVDGKRGFSNNIPLNTNVCLSDPKVRTTMALAIADYAQKQTNVDFLHVWLADGSNNHCECENCRKMRPSDWYIKLLNETDHILKQRDLRTRIVFICYVDTYWAPVTEKLEDSSHFTLLFAPITRTYRTSYAADADENAVRPYERNKLIFPKDEAENMAYYETWKKQLSCDVFCYEYHFYNRHFEDPGYTDIAKLVYDDIHGLKKWGLKGIVEDQSQRNYFPTGFPQYLYGRALWDDTLTLEEIREEYFSAAFGADWKDALAYVSEVSSCFTFRYTRTSDDPAARAKAASRIDAVIEKYRDILRAHTVMPIRVQTVSWQLLLHHSELVAPFAHALEARCEGRKEDALRLFDQGLDGLAKREALLQRYLDVGLIGRTMRRNFT